LEPFYFLISTSPRYWACVYESLCDWLQKAINHDLVVSENPFLLTEQQASIVLSTTSPVLNEWDQLLKALCDHTRLEELWVKFTVVDKILMMFGDEDWSEKNLSFFSLQHNVWWVAHVRPWFSLSHVRTSQEYIQTAMSALVLELWWRFVWARHTQRLFLEKAPKGLSNDLQVHQSIAESEEIDEILEQSELGDGSESESESVADSTLEEDETLLEQDDMGKLNHFFSGPHATLAEDEEENSSSDESSTDIFDGFHAFRSSFKGIIGEEAYENQIATDMKVDNAESDWLAEIPPATALFFAHPKIGDALDTIEKQFWLHEKWDCRPALDVLLNLTMDRNVDLQLPEQSRSLIISQMQYAYDKVFVPFLNQVGLEVSPPPPPVENEHQFDSNSLDALHSIWSFNPVFGTYWVDAVLKSTFDNLTTGGLVPAIHFIGLFPQLLLNADSKSDAQVSRVCQDLHSRLVARGTITPQLEALVKTLDSLTAEKNALLRQDKKQLRNPLTERKNSSYTMEYDAKQTETEEDPADPDATQPTWDPNSLEGRLHAHRMQRIKQIDIMIEEVRGEFSRMTGSVDQVVSKRKRKKTKTDSVLDMANFVSSPTAMPSDEALWGLPSLNPS
jgi:hypothetical protein